MLKNISHNVQIDLDYIPIPTLLEKIKQLDLEVYNNLSKIYEVNNLSKEEEKTISEKLQLELSALRAKHSRTQILKTQLKNYLSILENFKSSLNTKSYPYAKLLKTIQIIQDNIRVKYIENEDFIKLQTLIIDTINMITKHLEYQEAKAKFKENINEVLSSLGYNLIDSEIMEKLMKNEVIYLDTPYSEEYKIQLKIDEDNKIYYRLVKFGESITNYEKQKDIEIAKKWCQDYDKILELLKSKGILIENIKRLEPNESEILYIRKEEMKLPEKSKKKEEIKRGIREIDRE